MTNNQLAFVKQSWLKKHITCTYRNKARVGTITAAFSETLSVSRPSPIGE